MKDINGKVINVGDTVVRRKLSDGWDLDCDIPLIVIEAPEQSNRKFDLKTQDGRIIHMVFKEKWADMQCSGVVKYGYEIISKRNNRVLLDMPEVQAILHDESLSESERIEKLSKFTRETEIGTIDPIDEIVMNAKGFSFADWLWERMPKKKGG